MNNLKFNSLGITLILMISIFFTSCTKDDTIAPNIDAPNIVSTNTLNSRMPSLNWGDLTPQQQADFARFLGRLWGDGLPNNLNNLTGAKFTTKPTKHNQIYDRLKGIFDLPNNSTRLNLPDFWNYWVDALPGNNPGDPQILREAVKDPNFIAGLIDTEGSIRHNGISRYLIEDQTYIPSHPDENRGWGLRNFGPNRIIQLFSLLEETYGFSDTKIRIGSKEFNYAQKNQAIDEINSKYDSAKAMNENPNTGSSGFTVKIFINPAHFVELRSYGYWEKQNCDDTKCRFRSPAPDDASLNILTSDFPDNLSQVDETQDVENFQILHKESNLIMSSDLEIVPGTQGNLVTWSTIDVDGEYFRIVSNKNGKWLKVNTSESLSLVSTENTGWQTQWKTKQLDNGYFYLINRKFNNQYLRVGKGSTEVEIGVYGKRANWKFESVN